MSYRPKVKGDAQGTVTDLPLDAETLQGYKPCVNIVTLEDNNSTTAGTWLAKTDKVSALVDGQLFLYKITVAGASTTTLNITGSGGALGAKTVYRTGTTKLTTHYAVGHYILLAYNSLNTCFRVVNDYDSNSDTYVRQYQHGQNAAGATNLYPILTRYNLTNKSGTYDTAYARYYTDTYINVTNGYLYAPKVYSGGSEVAVKTDIPTETTVSGWGFTKFAGYTSSNKLNHSYIDYKWTRVLTPTIINPDSNQYVKITDISVSGTYRISSNSINHSVVVKIKYNGSENSDYFSIMTDSPIDDLMVSDTPRDIALLNVYIHSYGSYNQWEWTLTSSAGFFIGETGPSGGWFRKIDGTVTSVDSVSPSSGNVSLSAVRYVSQSLTDAQKTQARSNIGAGTGTVTSVRVQAGTGLSSSTSTASTTTLDTTISIASGYKLLTTSEYNILNAKQDKISVGTNGQLLSSNGSSLVWTDDNRSLLHHDLGVYIENTTTDNGWSMFNSTYNGFLLKSVRFNANSPSWGVGDFGSGIVFGGGDTKGVVSVAYRTPDIKIAGGNGDYPKWWIGLTGTSGKTYDLDELKAKPSRVTSSWTVSTTNTGPMVDIILAHPDIKIYYKTYTSVTRTTEIASVLFNASHNEKQGIYSLSLKYLNASGSLTTIGAGTIYYEYFE